MKLTKTQRQRIMDTFIESYVGMKIIALEFANTDLLNTQGGDKFGQALIELSKVFYDYLDKDENIKPSVDVEAEMDDDSGPAGICEQEDLKAEGLEEEK